MSVEKKIVHEARTLDQLREFVERCDSLGIPGDTTVHARTKAAWNPNGAYLVRVTAVHTESTR
ncbi:hypothetical protein [Pseudonocardia sp. NPDC049635]|uniref:hypothetical protein n=1 Tax=Pseudonocardia sp. NPDC049635 TaxID=3155506 RepID=UPI0033E0E7C5